MNPNHDTLPRLTKYERARLISDRAKQISLGAPVLIDPQGLSTAVALAEKEFELGLCPLKVSRYLPDGTVDEWYLQEFNKEKQF